MSASLVGSEMCIRDSPGPARLALPARRRRQPGGPGDGGPPVEAASGGGASRVARLGGSPSVRPLSPKAS
eukprot:4660446-Alexandrium_andersonii.AAC.1